MEVEVKVQTLLSDDQSRTRPCRKRGGQAESVSLSVTTTIDSFPRSLKVNIDDHLRTW